MGRIYSISAEQVAVSAAQDLLQIKGAAGKILRILRLRWANTDTTIPTAQMLSTRCRFLPATVTDGTGGTVPLINKIDPGDAAASLTALANNTTKATTSGTAVTVEESGDHISAGYDNTFVRPTVIGPSESFVFELLSTPSGTIHLSTVAIVEEIGG